MKREFWKYLNELISWITFAVISFILLVIGIVLIILNRIYPLFIIGLGMLLIFTLIIILNKRLLYKIQFSEKGIRVTRRKKEIQFIYWANVYDVKEKSQGLAISWLILITSDQEICIELSSQKMYDTIMALCPYEHIKMKINELQGFKAFHR